MCMCGWVTVQSYAFLSRLKAQMNCFDEFENTAGDEEETKKQRSEKLLEERQRECVLCLIERYRTSIKVIFV